MEGFEVINDMARCAEAEDRSADETRRAFVVMPIRPDRLGEMYAAGLIDQAQLRAGREWQACHTGLEHVLWRHDSKGAPVAIRLLKQLRRMDSAVGETGALLFRDVLARGYSVPMAAMMRGDCRKRDQRGWRDVLCACLSELGSASTAAASR